MAQICQVWPVSSENTMARDLDSAHAGQSVKRNQLIAAITAVLKKQHRILRRQPAFFKLKGVRFLFSTTQLKELFRDVSLRVDGLLDLKNSNKANLSF